MRPVGSLLGGFLQKVAEDEEVALIFMREMWPRIVGPSLAEQVRPISLAKKILVVSAPSESWQKEIIRMRPLLIESINRFWALKLVEKIRVQTHLMQGES